jgi:hypothetical protein
MAKITVSADIGEFLTVFKNFRLRIDKTLTVHAEGFLDSFETQLNAWKAELQQALGIPLDPSLWHSVRPNRSKLFPYKNTGELQESISVSAVMKVTGAGNFSITGKASIKAPQALLTNAGLRTPAPPTKPGAWIGWEDDVMGEEGRGGVMGIGDIFNRMSMERQILKGFEK